MLRGGGGDILRRSYRKYPEKMSLQFFIVAYTFFISIPLFVSVILITHYTRRFITIISFFYFIEFFHCRL